MFYFHLIYLHVKINRKKCYKLYLRNKRRSYIKKHRQQLRRYPTDNPFPGY